MLEVRVPIAVWREARARVRLGDRSGALRLMDGVPPAEPRRRATTPTPVAQLRLAIEEIRLDPSHTFVCRALDCEQVPAHVCLVRQLTNQVQRTEQASRGQASEHPACDTRRCEQGRAIRAALDPVYVETLKEAAQSRGGFHRERKRRGADAALQEAARARQERAGLLEEVRTLDVDRDPVDEEAQGT